jgi:hypothetical protein
MVEEQRHSKREAATVYPATLSNVSPTDSVVLHRAQIDDSILKWTKDHLDAYLASAAVMIDQRKNELG